MKIKEYFSGADSSNGADAGAGTNKGSGRKLKFAILVSLVLVGGVVMAVILSQRRQNPVRPETLTNEQRYFQGCTVLQDNCDTTDCGFYSYCGEGKKSCKIYDCDSEFGVLTVDASGRTDMEKVAKVEEDPAKQLAQSCAGETSFVSQECAGEETRVQVRIIPSGACPIKGFSVFFGDRGEQPATFERLGDGNFLLTSSGCGTVVKVVPKTEGGTALDPIVYIPR
jgi:hypothetical protein